MSQSHAVWAIVLLVLAIPLIFGMVPRNPVYGVRTKRTMASDEAWYPANRVTGYVLAVGAAVWLLTLLLRR